MTMILKRELVVATPVIIMQILMVQGRVNHIPTVADRTSESRNSVFSDLGLGPTTSSCH